MIDVEHPDLHRWLGVSALKALAIASSCARSRHYVEHRRARWLRVPRKRTVIRTLSHAHASARSFADFGGAARRPRDAEHVLGVLGVAACELADGSLAWDDFGPRVALDAPGSRDFPDPA